MSSTQERKMIGSYLIVYALGFITAPLLMMVIPPPTFNPPGLERRMKKMRYRAMLKKAKEERNQKG